MNNFYLPFPITEIESGVLLHYFIFTPELDNKKISKRTNKTTDQIKYQFVSYEDQNYCIFNDIYAVPMELFERLDLKTQRFLYFMKYGINNPYAEVFLVFEIDEEFMINYKAYKTYLSEYKKKLELEKNLNKNTEENSLKKENFLKPEEKTESVFN